MKRIFICLIFALNTTLPLLASELNVVFDTLPVVGENSLLSWSNATHEANTVYIATSATEAKNPFTEQSGSLYIANSTGSNASTLNYMMFEETADRGRVTVNFNLVRDGLTLNLGRVQPGETSIGNVAVRIRFLADQRPNIDQVGNATNIGTAANTNVSATIEWVHNESESGFTLKINDTYAAVDGSTFFDFRTATPQINAIGLATRTGTGRESEYFLGSMEAVVIPEPSTVALLAGLGALGLIVLRKRALKRS